MKYATKIMAVLFAALVLSFGISAQKLRNDSFSVKTAGVTGPTIHVSDEIGYPSDMVILHVTVDSTGMENSIQFSLSYDQTKLSNPVVVRGGSVQEGNFEVLYVQNGIGIWTYFPDQQTALPEGVNEIATIQFDIEPTADGETPIDFTDSPTSCSIIDVNAQPMTGTWDSGVLTILGPTAAPVTVDGNVFDEAGSPIRRATVSLMDQYGHVVTTQTNQFGWYQFTDVEPDHVYVVRVQHSKYIFRTSSRAISLLDNMSGVDFYGETR